MTRNHTTPEEHQQLKRLGITQSCFSKRINLLNWSREKALSTPPRKKHITLTETEKQISESVGTTIGTIRHRVNNGMPRDVAIRTPPHHNDEWQKVKDIAEKNGVSPATFRSRRQRNWSILKAVQTPVRDRSTRWIGDTRITPKMEERMEQLDISISTLRSRLHMMTVEEALSYPKLNVQQSLRLKSELKQNNSKDRRITYMKVVQDFINEYKDLYEE